MNKMEDYLVERNKAFIQLNSRGFKDSKHEGPTPSPLPPPSAPPQLSVPLPLSAPASPSPLARGVAAAAPDTPNSNPGNVEQPQAQAGESASGKPIAAPRNKNPTDPINITVNPTNTNTVTINNEIKGLDKLMEKLDELLTRREQAVNDVQGSQGPQGPKVTLDLRDLRVSKDHQDQ